MDNFDYKTLFSISESIAAVQDNKQLLRVIYEKIKPVFPYDNAGLFVIDKTGESWSEILDSDILPDAVQTELTETGNLGPFPLAGYHPKAWHNSETPIICLLAEQADYYDHQFIKSQFAVGIRHGLRQMIGGPLYHAGRKIGFLSFNSKQENFYTEKHIGLFKAVTDLVAIAVANILAKEEILEREREKAVLLDISEAIASIRDRNELFSFIVDKVQPLFGFNQYSNICTLDEEGATLKFLFTKMTAEEQQGESINNFGQVFPVAGIFQTIINSNDVIIIDETWKTSPKTDVIDEATAQIWRDLDFKYALSTALRSFDKVIGTFHVHFFEEQNFTEAQLRIFKAISEQIAVAVANILANEEILEREKEKALLLSLSEDMATIRDRDDLWRVMMNKVRPLVEFEDAVLLTLNEELTEYGLVMTMSPPERREHALYEVVVGRNSVSGSPVEWYLHQPEDFILQDLRELEADATFPNRDPAVRMMKQTGLWFSLVHKLYWGDRLVGLLFFHYARREQAVEGKFSLYKAIADQVTVAVANILANEEIIEREKEKALLLSLSEDMATIRNREDLWQVMMQKIRPLVGFDDAVVAVYSKDKLLANHILTVAPHERRRNPNYKAIVNHPIQIPNSPIEYLIRREGNFLISTDEFFALYPDHPGIKLMRETSLEYTLHYKLVWGGELIGQFHFHFERREQIQEVKLNLYKAIANQVTVAVANILANEEILRLAEERRERAEELARTNEAVQRSMRRLSNEASPDAFVFQLHQELCDLLGGEVTAQFRLDWEAQRINGGVIVDNNRIATSVDSVFRSLDLDFESVPAWRSGLEEDRILRFEIERDAAAMSQITVKFMRERGLTWLINLPLYVRAGPAWVLAVVGRDKSKLTERNFELFRQLSRQLTLALELRQLGDEARDAAIAREQERAANERAAKLTEANELLRASVESLTNAERLDRFLGYILLAITQQLDANSSTVWLNDNAAKLSHLKFVVENGAVIPAAECTHPNRLAPAPIFPDTTSSCELNLSGGKAQPELAKVRDNHELTDELRNFLEERNVNRLLTVPMTLGGEQLGKFRIWIEDGKKIAVEDMELVQALANQATLALQLTRLNEEATLEAAAAAVFKDRNRIAGEIHDTLAQSFTAIVVQLQAGRRGLSGDSGKSVQHLETAIKVAREGLTEARRSVQALRPRTLDERGFVETLRQMLRRMTDGSVVKGNFELAGIPHPLSEDVSISLMRICQEAVTNAVRHAAARNITVELSFGAENEVVLTIADDGTGFNYNGAFENDAQTNAGFGLLGMKERAARIGAKFELESEPDRGTRIVVSARS